MKQEIVTEGPLFEKLDNISCGKWMTIRLPIAHPVKYDGNTGYIEQPIIEYEEWEPITLPDGGHGWIRRGR